MSITKVTWKKKGNGSKVSKTESAYFQHESAVRFAKHLTSEPGVSEIKLVEGLTMAEVRVDKI